MKTNKAMKHDDDIIDLTSLDDIYASRDVIKLDEEDAVLPKTPRVRSINSLHKYTHII